MADYEVRKGRNLAGVFSSRSKAERFARKLGKPEAKPKTKKARGKAVSRNFVGPSEWLLRGLEYQCWPPMLFDDGSVGTVTEVLYDPDYWAENYTREELLLDGVEPYGEIYIDRYYLDTGELSEGACYLYWQDDTLGSWCRRNGEPLPVRKLPEEVWDMLENSDEGMRRELERSVPELRRLRFA